MVHMYIIYVKLKKKKELNLKSVFKIIFFPFWHSCLKNYNSSCAYIICVQYKAKFNPNMKFDFFFLFSFFFHLASCFPNLHDQRFKKNKNLSGVIGIL